MRRAAAALAIAGAVLVAISLATAGGEGGDREAGRSRAAAVGAPAPRGLAVWAEQGCGSCHAFAPAGAQGVIGPDLTSSLDGRGEEYIRTSIVAPGAAAAPGWSGSTMPPDYAQRITPEELDALVDFLAAG